MSKLFTFDLDQEMQVRLAALAGQLTNEIRQQISDIPREMAQAAYYKAQEIANTKLNSTAMEYISALDFAEVSPGEWSVYLLDSAKHLEEGYAAFDMKPGLLRNAKKISKAGYKYRVIPMFNSNKGQMQAKGKSMMGDLKTLRAGLGDEGLNKNADGQPLLGKIFTITKNDVGMWSLNPKQPGVEAASARFSEPGISDNLVGVQKTQYAVKGRGGKISVKSSFVTFRVVSANPLYAEKFQHPGYTGIHAFDELTKWAGEKLDRMLQDLLS